MRKPQANLSQRPILMLFFTALAAGAFLTVGCSDKQRETNAATSRTEPTLGQRAEDAANRTASAAREMAGDVADATAEKWEDIKDATYDQRQKITASVNRMGDKIDHKLAEWNAKRPELSADARKAWDKSVDTLRDARESLSKATSDLGNATADTWDAAKKRVGEAWDRVERAYDDLKERAAS